MFDAYKLFSYTTQMKKARFAVGDYVKLVGPLSEHYGEAAATVVNVYLPPHLSHLNQYRIHMPGGDDVFYEFQLALSIGRQDIDRRLVSLGNDIKKDAD
jgi:hypothetical protein